MSLPDDLLQPSLTEDDDLKGFKKPWNPQSLVFAAFFAGPFAGGFLLSLNFKRLGMSGKFWKSLLLFVALGLVMYATIILLHTNGIIEKGNSDQKQLCRIIVRVITIAAAYWAATIQRERFRLFEYSGGDAASAWVPGILAVVVGYVASILAFSLIYSLLSVFMKAT